MAESSGQSEVNPSQPQPEEPKNWDWEVILDPRERSNLIRTTIEEVVMQTVVGAAGFAELASSQLSQHASGQSKAALRANERALLAAQQLRGLQRVLEMNPNEPLPIDRKTFPETETNRAFIVLKEVPGQLTIEPLEMMKK